MEQRDYLKEQIEQAARVVMRLLGDFLALDRKGDLTLSIRQTNQQLNEEADFDVEGLFDLSPEELAAYVGSRGFSEGQLEVLARYLYGLAIHCEVGDNGSNYKYRDTALRLLDLADGRTQTFSFERSRLRTLLN